MPKTARLAAFAAMASLSAPPTAMAQHTQLSQSAAVFVRGDSVYRTGRLYLARGDYASAARTLQELEVRFPGHPLAGDALYWSAVALRGIGTRAALGGALDLLDRQRRNHPRTGTRTSADLLELQVCGEVGFATGSAMRDRCAARLDAVVGQPCADPQLARLRAAGIFAMVRTGSARSALSVRDFVDPASGCPAELRQQLLILALELDDSPRNEILMSAATDTAPAVQRRAVRLLAEVPTEASVQRLKQFASSPNSLLGREALDALAQNTALGARRALREMITTPPSSTVQAPAIEALADNLHGEDDVQFLFEQFKRMGEAGKIQVVRSLGQRQDERVRAWIIGVASDTGFSHRFRVQAIRALAQETQGMEVLLDFYDTRSGRLLAADLLRVFASEGEESGTAKLRDVMQKDPDPSLRALAARLLRHEMDEDSRE